MRNPEIRQKGESREDYVRRISKLPIISPNTILRAVFPTVSQDTLRYIKDCARPVFPKAFPPTDSNGIPFINPENISTKEFANWVVEKNMFEVWIALGEKVSPSAELFIELVLGKCFCQTVQCESLLLDAKFNKCRPSEVSEITSCHQF